MAPLDQTSPLLATGAPGVPGQALTGIWAPGAAFGPGYGGDKALLSTGVSHAGEARAQFTTRPLSIWTGEGSVDGEAEKRPYRPGEMLQQSAKLAAPGLTEPGTPPSVGTLTPERPSRRESEGSGSSGGSSDSEGVFSELCSSMPFKDASRELGAPLVGSPDVPTMGSAGHWYGTCKPCAFAFKGCQNGAACLFCHLCLPGEKQRRRKMSKMANKKMWRQMKE
uniref:C3H1-type domain-containing protein n=1 Tax=Alexandrium catenella TaxID=2925 RepID=A0A7S1Q7W5_ALECA